MQTKRTMVNLAVLQVCIVKFRGDNGFSCVIFCDFLRNYLSGSHLKTNFKIKVELYGKLTACRFIEFLEQADSLP